jgi:hypothetical protein
MASIHLWRFGTRRCVLIVHPDGSPEVLLIEKETNIIAEYASRSIDDAIRTAARWRDVATFEPLPLAS